MRTVIIAATVAGLGLAGVANAATIFEEDFSGDLVTAGGDSVTNFNSFDQFGVTDGTVDILSSGGKFNLSCATGGACVDLDGSSNNSGLFSSIALDFAAGVNYVFNASLSGSQRGSGSDTGSYGITGIFEATYNLGAGDPFADFSQSFTVSSDTTGSIFFQDDGNDNVGAILDKVSVTGTPSGMAPVPLPASALLLLGALGGIAGMRRRRG